VAVRSLSLFPFFGLFRSFFPFVSFGLWYSSNRDRKQSRYLKTFSFFAPCFPASTTPTLFHQPHPNFPSFIVSLNTSPLKWTVTVVQTSASPPVQTQTLSISVHSIPTHPTKSSIAKEPPVPSSRSSRITSVATLNQTLLCAKFLLNS
jgi:hypothetical protein